MAARPACPHRAATTGRGAALPHRVVTAGGHGAGQRAPGVSQATGAPAGPPQRRTGRGAAGAGSRRWARPLGRPARSVRRCRRGQRWAAQHGRGRAGPIPGGLPLLAAAVAGRAAAPPPGRAARPSRRHGVCRRRAPAARRSRGQPDGCRASRRSAAVRWSVGGCGPVRAARVGRGAVPRPRAPRAAASAAVSGDRRAGRRDTAVTPGAGRRRSTGIGSTRLRARRVTPDASAARSRRPRSAAMRSSGRRDRRYDATPLGAGRLPRRAVQVRTRSGGVRQRPGVHGLVRLGVLQVAAEHAAQRRRPVGAALLQRRDRVELPGRPGAPVQAPPLDHRR